MDNSIQDMDETFEYSEEKIFNLLEEKKYFQCRDELLKFNAVDIAEMLEDVMREYDMQKAVVLFRTLPKDVSVEVFPNMDVDNQVEIINIITDPEIQYILDELDFDDMIDVLEELPANLVDKILEKTPKNERRQINTFLRYKENSAGSLMTPDYIELRKDMTTKEALAHIKEVGMDSETIYTAYVLSGGRKLIGIVSLRSLVIAPDHEKVSELMHEDIILAHVDDDQEEVSDLFKRYGFLALPVVDNEGRLVGIITVDDILDVIEEEMTEDIERMGGVIDSTDKEYLDMPVMDHVKAELPWLLLLMCSYFITGRADCPVRGCPVLCGGAGGIHADADGHRRKLRNPDHYSGGAGNVHRRNRDGRRPKSVLEGVPSEHRDRYLRQCGELRADYFAGPQRHAGGADGVRLHAADRHHCQVLRRAASDGGKKNRHRPALMSGPMMASLTDMVSLGTYFIMAKYFLNL